MPKKIMFARLDFSTFLICCSGDLSDNESDEKPSVAICGGSICILTGLLYAIYDKAMIPTLYVEEVSSAGFTERIKRKLYDIMTMRISMIWLQYLDHYHHHHH